MKMEIKIPAELYDDMVVCAAHKQLTLHEYVIVAIAGSVAKDFKSIFGSEEIDNGDDV